MARVVQDDARERTIATHCGLRHLEARAGPDAFDEAGNPFELKSATISSVSTARDVGLHTIKEWRKKYWVVAVGVNLDDGFRIDAMYIAHPGDLEIRIGEIEEKLRADWDHCELVLEAARELLVPPKSVARAEYILQRGVTLNNPKIPLWVFEQHGKRISHDDAPTAQKQLMQFVIARPLDH